MSTTTSQVVEIDREYSHAAAPLWLMDAGGAVPNATCYRTPAAISEPGFRWPPLDLCYPVHREAALGRRASVALALAIVVIL